jgi:hypothetical protein
MVRLPGAGASSGGLGHPKEDVSRRRNLVHLYSVISFQALTFWSLVDL